MSIEDDVDRLYQVPLDEFTPARNALAKQAGGDRGAEVKQLQKPTVAAWAVNQLYWQDRRVYDDVVKAAEKLRTAHRALLSGKNADVHEAEAAHRERVRAAVDRVRQLLEAGGEKATAATMMAVSETLDALPTDEEPAGRLTRPLKRMGFEALAGITPVAGGRRPPPKLSLVKGRAKAAPPPAEPSPARKQEIDATGEKLRAIEADARRLESEVEQGRRALKRVEQQHERLEQELAEAADNLRAATADLQRREQAYERAVTERDKLRDKLDTLKED